MCFTMGSLEPLLEQAVSETIESGIKHVEVQRSRHDTKKTGLKISHYRRSFCKNEVVDCLVLEQLELTAEEAMRKEVVSARVTRNEEK